MSHRQFFIFALFLVLFALLVSTPDVGVDAQSNSPSLLTLNISGSTGTLHEGDTAAFIIEVSNTAVTPLSRVTLHLPGFVDLTYTGAGAYPLADHLVELGTLPGQTTVQIPVTAVVSGLPRTDVTLSFSVRAVETDAVSASTTLSFAPPAAETAALSAGLTTTFAGGLISLDLSNSTLAGGSNEVQVHLQERHHLAARDTGIILAFALTAVGSNSELGTAVATGNIHLDISNLVHPTLLTSDNLALYTRSTTNNPWEQMPFTLDVNTGIVTLTGKDFGEYLLTEEPEPWALTYTPPGSSAFTGAAQFSYAFAVPPGVGGLTPSLSLHYNSRGIETLKAPLMSRGFGLGWSMPQMEITNDNAGEFYDDEVGWNACPSLNTDAYTLAINGVSYQLKPKSLDNGRHGEYVAAGDPSLRILFRQDGPGGAFVPNLTGEYWQVSQADGTVYTFGLYLNSEQVIAPLKEDCGANAGQPWYPNTFAVASWKLDTSTDKYGNTVKYTYQEVCGMENDVNGQLRDGYNNNTACTEVDSAVAAIEYNDVGTYQKTVIEFENGMTNTEARNRYKMMTVGFLRPSRISVRVNNTLISRYIFSYEEFHHRVFEANPYNLFYWWVKDITRYDATGDSPLPTTHLSYNQILSESGGWDSAPQWRHAYILTEVSNGYGGFTKLFYEKWPGTDWLSVTDVYTWDGVEHKYNSGDPASVQTHYERTNPCFDVDNSPCRTLRGDERTKQLMGFANVEITAGPPGNDGLPIPVMSKQVMEFNTSSYWLNGKTITAITYDPASGQKLTEHRESWDWVDNPTFFARLDSVTGCSFDGSNFLGTKTDYTYDITFQGDVQWGKVTHTTTSTISGSIGSSCQSPATTTTLNTSVTRYLKSDTPLRLIVPWVTRLHDGGAGGSLAARTFYLYDGATDPDGQTLILGELNLTRVQASVENLVPGSGNTVFPTIDTTMTYNSHGNVESVTQYDSYGEIGYVGTSSDWSIGTVWPAGNSWAGKPV